MEIACGTRGIVSAEFPRQGIMDLAKAGFREIMMDIFAYADKNALEAFGTGKKAAKRSKLLADGSSFAEVVRPFFEICERESMAVTSAYAPYLARDTKRTDLNGLIETLAVESIRRCGKAGCRMLVVRPLFSGIAREAVWETNQVFYLRLAKVAKEANVQILLENQGRDVSGHLVRGLCADETEAARWVDDLNMACGEERFGFAMNLGIASICGQNPYEFIAALGRRLKLVLVSDIDGMGETALLPFTGASRGTSKTDWLNFVRGLRSIEFDGTLALHFEDTASAFSPLLRPALLQFAKTTAAYIRWQVKMETLLKKYPSRVLFGAGNMCRAYMKCYGDTYPPLYTCDNNRSLWETTFEGLTVKSPEALKTLSEDVAIFICNTYYRDIKRQLREMEIKNPIEFFNDEYLPSFHFDRVEDLDAERGRR